MARRRGARAGRGWDAIPPRPAADPHDEKGHRPAADPHDEEGPRRRSWPNSAAGEGGAPANRNDAELAREICLRQLATRPRTRTELAQALARRHIDDDVITEVLDRYDEVGIIDDAAFARAWVSSRHAGRGLARRVLAGELRQRGVAGDLVGEALETLDAEQEAATARTLVDRKLRTATGPPDAVFRRLVGMLARKGYPAGLAISAVKDALAARDAEAAEFAEQIDPDALADATVEPAPAGEIGEPGGMRDI